MLRWPTVESAHMTLGLVSEIFDAIDVVVTIGKELGVVDPEVMEVRHIQHIVTTPAVGIDDTIGHNFAFDDGDQRGPGRVWNDLCINLSTPF